MTLDDIQRDSELRNRAGSADLALTFANLGLLAFLLTRVRADNPGVLPVLRRSTLEIVDEHGRVRAQPRVFPADAKHRLTRGDPYPETVLLRLVDPNGRPSVTLATDVRGGGSPGRGSP